MDVAPRPINVEVDFEPTDSTLVDPRPLVLQELPDLPTLVPMGHRLFRFSPGGLRDELRGCMAPGLRTNTAHIESPFDSSIAANAWPVWPVFLQPFEQ